ncbi:hypothetical protein ABIE78_005619 [Sinorhizobium fredii]
MTPDGAGDGGFAGDDAIAGERDQVAGRGGERPDVGDHRLFGCDLADRLVEHFATIGGAARRRYGDDQSLGGIIVGDPLQSLDQFAVVLDKPGHGNARDVLAGPFADLGPAGEGDEREAAQDENGSCRPAPEAQLPAQAAAIGNGEFVHGHLPNFGAGPVSFLRNMLSAPAVAG